MKYIVLTGLLAINIFSSEFKFNEFEVSTKISKKILDLRGAQDREKKKKLIQSGYTCKLVVQTKHSCSKHVRVSSIPLKIKKMVLEKYENALLIFGEKYQNDELVLDAPAVQEYKIYRRVKFIRSEEVLIEAEMYKLFKLRDGLEKMYVEDNMSIRGLWINIKKKKLSMFKQYNVKTADGYDKFLVDIKYKRVK